MPNEWIYIGTEEDGTEVYWNPFYCKAELRKPNGEVISVDGKF